MSAYQFGWLTQQQIDVTQLTRELNTRLRALVHDFESGTIALTTRATTISALYTFTSGVTVSGSVLKVDPTFAAANALQVGDGTRVAWVTGTRLLVSGDVRSMSPAISDAITIQTKHNASADPAALLVIPEFVVDAGAHNLAGANIGALTLDKGSALTTTDYKALQLFEPLTISGTGTVTTAYGLLILDIACGGTNYAIYTGAGLVRFGGALTVAASVTVSTGGITVTGNSTMAGTLGGVTTLTCTTVTATNLGGTLSTAAQPNVTSVGTLTALTVSGQTTMGALLRLKGYTVAGLPAGTQGDTAFVTDALAPAFLTAVVGGGAIVTPVFFDGTNWVSY